MARGSDAHHQAKQNRKKWMMKEEIEDAEEGRKSPRVLRGCHSLSSYFSHVHHLHAPRRRLRAFFSSPSRVSLTTPRGIPVLSPYGPHPHEVPWHVSMYHWTCGWVPIMTCQKELDRSLSHQTLSGMALLPQLNHLLTLWSYGHQ